MISQKRPKTLRGRVRRWFPERQIHIRTDGHIRFFRISTAFQTSLACLFSGFLIWTAYSTWEYVQHEQVVEDKKNQISNARLAYHSLLGEVAEYQKKFASITEDLENNHSMMLGLVEKNSSLRQSLNSVSRRLVATQTERGKIESARELLKQELVGIETQLRETASKNYSLKDNLSSVENNLQSVLEERNKALFEGTRVRRQLKILETRLSQMQDDQDSAVQRLTRRAVQSIEGNEKIIQLAGLDANSLLKLDNHLPDGQGGPFIPAAADDKPGGQLRADLDNLDNYLERLEALKAVITRIPLTSPLDTYRVTSSYGKRRDPKNKKWAAHYGLDMASHKNSKIYAPASGVVSFAGWKGNYGRMIEIDHGAGLKTRYAHLNKILVKRGQKVSFRDKIGLLGNSGRSTGAHLHYEVVFNGNPKNPSNFIKAGRHVFQEQ